ncbi:diguanylate cyclase domain-containing protein [Halalkalibacter alkaliphilus]|uniref:Diguanylate cyclase n=1 Tax=Halalkalibacter alkaliphilus TaxID=2917993 RepID=A0A9X2CT44_9BACI|nr:diguanylate cyclase [Halalkalibacter alkaliphilus]MCL7747821.1 diguanylate cyclase [Halalkalibacter alkaliphilus]
MDSLKHDNKKYENILDKIVSRIIENESFRKPAIFFIASEVNILSLHEVGYIPKILAEAKSYFQQTFLPRTTPIQYGEARQFISPIFRDTCQSLYFGVIVQCQKEEIDTISKYIEAISNGIASSYSELAQPKQSVTTEELLMTADYEVMFTKLAKALVHCWAQRDTNHHLTIYNMKHNRLIAMGSSKDLPISEITLSGEFENNLLSSHRIPLIMKGSLFIEEKDQRTYLIFPIVFEEKVVAVFSFSYQVEEEAYKEKSNYEWINRLIPLFQKGYGQEKEKEVEKRKDILMQVAKKFHSTIDIAKVLDGIVDAIKKAYPKFKVHLLISQEWQVNEELPIKPFLYGTRKSDPLVEQAYLSGRVQLAHALGKDNIFIFAPLRGKQGVYGVMEIETVDNSHIPKEEVDFIKVLADTGGIALENAELFQQSHKLIHDLQLINKTSHQLNLNLRLADTINFMTRQITESFGAEHVGFIIFQSKGESIVLEGSSQLFLEETIIEELAPFIKTVKREKDAVFIGDTDLQNINVLEGFQSVLAVPMIQNKQLKGIVIAIHRNKNHFSFDNFKLLQSLVHHSTLAFTNSMLHEELEKLVITDHLTRLHSRSYLDECIQQSLMNDRKGTLLLLDIDNFKKVNDTFGHQVGDDIIIQVANVLKRNIRDGDIAARWGGEELAIYFPKVDVEIGLKIARRILRAVELETSPRVTASIGLSHWSSNDHDITLQKLLKLADQGLYDAKETGKNRVVVK